MATIQYEQVWWTLTATWQLLPNNWFSQKVHKMYRNKVCVMLWNLNLRIVKFTIVLNKKVKNKQVQQYTQITVWLKKVS